METHKREFAFISRRNIMIYLSGKKIQCTDQIGVMLSFNAGKQRISGHDIFAADNGCFVQPDKYSDEGFINWLKKLDAKSCLFATAPDVVGDAQATRLRAYPMLRKIREMGFKASYVCQDGERPDLIDWQKMDAVFIGGSTEWKLSQAAGDIIAEAKRRSKWVHMGRVNSYRRMRLAAVLGCDSVDGTMLAFAPDKNLIQLNNWLKELNNQTIFKL